MSLALPGHRYADRAETTDPEVVGDIYGLWDRPGSTITENRPSSTASTTPGRSAPRRNRACHGNTSNDWPARAPCVTVRLRR